MTNDDDVKALLQRVRLLEDRLAIFQLLASYGPGVDSVSIDAVADMWTEDGKYEIVGVGSYAGNRDVAETMLNGEMHQRYVDTGCGHVISMPYVVISGDTAVATSHARIYLNQGGYWRVERLSAVRWELVRTPEGWKIENRINYPLTGNPGARELLGRELSS